MYGSGRPALTGPGFVRVYLTPYVVAGRTRGLNNVSALSVLHFEHRGVHKIPGKIVQESNTRKAILHELGLSGTEPVPVPGIHPSRLATR